MLNRFGSGIGVEGIQNRPPQDVPIWHVNCFELKVVKTLWAHEKLVLLP